jgi:hypothetical protein
MSNRRPADLFRDFQGELQLIVVSRREQ